MKQSFYKKHKTEIEAIGSSMRSQLLDDVIPFWEKRVGDWKNGGYFNCFDRTGKQYSDKKSGWFVGRDMYIFSALYRKIRKDQLWLDLAALGREYMKTGFYAGNGRFQKMLSGSGEVLEGTTSIFTDHFAVKGLCEYIKACGMADQSDISFAEYLTDTLLKNVKDKAILRAEGIPEGMQKHAMNFMTLIVLLEGREVFGDYYDRELKDCIRRSLYEFADDSKKVPLEYVGTDGRPTYWKEGRLVDAGHTMESLWFSIYAGQELGTEEYRIRAGEILDWVIDLCYDETYGGFIQNADMDGGKPEEEFCVTEYCGIPAAWDSKIWWVQAEGLNALFMSALYNENEKHFHYFKKLYEYTERRFRDREYGEWYAILDREGNILCDRKGFELKGPYHIPRCLMEISLLAEKYIESRQKSDVREDGGAENSR